MTPNDISTPKKAEDAPRQALELLAEEWEIEGIQLCDGVHASVPNAFAGQTYQRCAQELREALRAQAEAAADKERRYRLALLGLQRQDTGCWCYTLTGGHAPECLQARAALAQAGGEQAINTEPRVCPHNPGGRLCGPEDGWACGIPACLVPTQAGDPQ